MSKKHVVKKVTSVFLVVTLVGALTACGSSVSDTNSSSLDDTTVGSDENVTVIPVGVCNSAKPDGYVDDDGNLTGFDVETLRAIDELLPQYEFDIQGMQFAEILNSLSTGKVLIGSQQFEWTQEREDNYLFASVPLVSYDTYVITLKDSQYDNITGLADLADKTTLVSVGGSTEAQIATWNEENPDAHINTVYWTEADELVNDLNNGVADSLISTYADYDYMAQNNDLSNWEIHYDAKVYDSNSYILLGKDQTELQEAVDGALQELTDNGTLAELSVKFLGDDYTIKTDEVETDTE